MWYYRRNTVNSQSGDGYSRNFSHSGLVHFAESVEVMTAFIMGFCYTPLFNRRLFFVCRALNSDLCLPRPLLAELLDCLLEYLLCCRLSLKLWFVIFVRKIFFMKWESEVV
jgi:hypothetical protein